MYEYRVVQIPPNVVSQAGAPAAVRYLQQLVNFGIEKGWEFYRVDTLGIPPAQSCQVVTFRRECVYNAPPQATAPARHPEPAFEQVVQEEPREEKPWWR